MSTAPGGRRTLAVTADLVVDGPGLRARVVGDGHELRAVVEGRPAAIGRATARRGAGLLTRAGLRLRVEDPHGRLLAEAGEGVHSPLGRLLLGTGAIRPTLRLVAARRLRAA